MSHEHAHLLLTSTLQTPQVVDPLENDPDNALTPYTVSPALLH